MSKGFSLAGLQSPLARTLKLRRDEWGDGSFGAPRAGRHHTGIDIVGRPGEDVFPMCRERVVRIGYPYSDDLSYRLIVTTPAVEEPPAVFYYFYVDPLQGVDRGEILEPFKPFAKLQDVSKRYHTMTMGPMKPHLHLAIALITPIAVRLGRWGQPLTDQVYVDPALFLDVT